MPQIEVRRCAERRKKVIYIGIDAGVHNGWAVWDSRKHDFIELKTLDFWPLIDEIEKLEGSDVVVYVEDPQQNKPVFYRKGTNSKMKQKIAQNVGGNKAYAQLIIRYLQIANIKHFCVRPSKSTMTKLNADQFQRLTGYSGRCSQHARDSACLVFGR